MTRKLIPILLAVAVVLATPACAEAYSREEFVRDLEATGIPADQANCIADGLVADGDLERFANADQLTPEEQQRLVELTGRCVLGVSGLELPADAGAG